MAANQPLLVFTNCENSDNAEHIARWLLQQKLAACVNILPAVTSMYHWQGKLEQAQEVMLMIKTNQQQFEKIKPLFVAQHSYELPELIAVSITDGLPAYLQWLQQNLNP